MDLIKLSTKKIGFSITLTVYKYSIAIFSSIFSSALIKAELIFLYYNLGGKTLDKLGKFADSLQVFLEGIFPHHLWKIRDTVKCQKLKKNK